ncbi:TerD family protein [Nocardia sp. PE-7]|uniref:TerD family protein n=1 Tax=Nocardia sp. PE-7 TaxID=3058426 RepID=UPI00265B367E|nr:TerD family protein [Nocardia sp. PE-7]WKG12725.1 TerD family protein [Nocardia sp. PE-7]
MTHALTHLSMGLGWDPAHGYGTDPRPKDIDLNAAVLSFAGDHFVDVAYHEQLTSRDGALRLLGDSVTGDGHGDNEVIVVDVSLLDPAVTTIVFLVTCYTGQRFDQIVNGFCRIVDNVTGIELIRIDLDSVGAHTGIVVGKLHRPQQDWVFTMIGRPIMAQHVVNAVPQLAVYLD